ncbi:MAG: hypothetical protein ACTHQ3_15955 [Motilibacteraceae bacterium]
MSNRRGLKFSEASHRYWLDGKPVPGVTTILGVLDKKALPKWAAGEVATYVADHPDGVETLRGMGRGPMIAALKGIPWQKRDDAGHRGNVLHDYAEQLLKGQQIDVADEHVAVMESALDFMADWHIEPLLIEAPVASREHQWAGTLDLIARYRRPDTGARGVAIFDWKSGKAIYPEFAWQLGAYGHAEFTGLDGDEQPLPATDAAFGVQIRADGYDVHPLAYGPEIYAEFITIRQTYEIAKRGRGDWRKPGTGYVGLAVQSPEEGAA